MAESDSTYRISGLYVTPNWNGNRDRVAMSCGFGANIKVLRKVSIDGKEVIIAADAAGTMARSWNMTARNTILRTAAKVYLYARVERDGESGMYIWSANVYNIDGTTADPDVKAVNNELYYYVRVGSLEENRSDYEIDQGQYGAGFEDEGNEGTGYSWSDLIAWDRGRDLLVFLKTIAGLAIEYIILAGHELRYVLTGKDIKTDEDGNYIKTEHEESDNAVVTGGFLKAWLDKISGKFLRKDRDDETTHTLTMGAAVSDIHYTRQFTATSGAMGGVGAGMWMLEDGTGIMETDLFYVRRAAYFRSLTIAEVKHMGGEVILSAAACQIAYVVPYDIYGNPISATVPDASASVIAFYRCYFEKQANGRKVYNEWMEDDQARCQRFDADGNEAEGSFYWRLVVGVGEDEDFYYVDLSFDDCAPRSNAPKSNDNIVLFGHRDPDAATYDRTCAQMYSTVGIHAPSRAYYSGITSYDLSQAQRPEYLERDAQGNVEWYVGGFDDNSGKEHYIKYNTRTGLDIRTNSMTVIADGKDVSVGEALGDNFQFITSSDKAPTENGEVAKWIQYDDIEPSKWWSNDECVRHIGDYLITSDGFTYEFVYDTTNGLGWQISSDEYLINAQKDAQAALDNLNDMASDNVITRQEKVSLQKEYQRLQAEGNNLLNEVASIGLAATNFRLWYDAYVNYFLSYILMDMENDTELYKEDTNEHLVLNTQHTPKVFYGTPDERPNTPSGKNVSFVDCYTNFIYYYSAIRSDITRKMNRDISSIIVSGSVNDAVAKRLDDITLDLYGENGEGSEGSLKGTVSKLDGDYGALINRVEYIESNGDKKWIIDKGFVTLDNFAAMFAKATDDRGNKVAEAIISTSVQFDPKTYKITSDISLSADKIDFAAADITMFSQKFRIDADNFKVNENGVYVMGEIHATSGTFDGTVKASQGFQLGYKSVRYVEENRDEDEATILDKGDSVVFVEYRVKGPGVILPQQPLDGQVVKIISIGSFPVRVYSNNSDIVKLDSQSRSVTVPAHSVGEFIYGQNKWYYTGNYNCS